MNPRGRRAAAWLVATLVALGLCVGTPPTGSAAVPTAGTLTATPSRAIAGESVTLAGVVPPRQHRPVALQRKSGGSWVSVDKQRASSTGRFSFTIRARSTSTVYRVLAPRWLIGGHTYPTVQTPARTVTTLAQRATLSLPLVTGIGADTAATATLTPARTGRTVRLERWAGDAWTLVDSGGEDSSGRVAFTVNEPQAGSFRYRVVAVAWKGAAAVASPARTVRVGTQDGRFVTGVSGNGRYFVDQAGDPILVKGDSPWAILVNASPAQMDMYVATRAAQGFNTVLVSLLGNPVNGGPASSGATYDGVLPFVNGDPAVLNDAYWDRVEHFVAACHDAGITVMAYPIDGWVGTSYFNGVARSWTTAKAQEYGAAVAARLSGYDNVIWSVGGDYSPESPVDARFNAVLTGLRAGGMDRPATIQLIADTTSLSSTYWDEKVDFSFVYSYALTYAMEEVGYKQVNPAAAHVPAILGETHYEAYSRVTNLYLRSQAAWALTSGSPGEFYGSENVWSSVPTSAALTTTAVSQLSSIRATIEGLDGWERLVPDFSSTFITAGRGTKGNASTDYFSGNTYVTGARTADGTLAVVYLPSASRAITLNTALMGPGYTARWVDPTSGDSVAASTADATYSHAGANKAGAADWLLVLESSTPR